MFKMIHISQGFMLLTKYDSKEVQSHNFDLPIINTRRSDLFFCHQQVKVKPRV